MALSRMYIDTSVLVLASIIHLMTVSATSPPGRLASMEAKVSVTGNVINPDTIDFDMPTDSGSSTSSKSSLISENFSSAPPSDCSETQTTRSTYIMVNDSALIPVTKRRKQERLSSTYKIKGYLERGDIVTMHVLVNDEMLLECVTKPGLSGWATLWDRVTKETNFRKLDKVWLNVPDSEESLIAPHPRFYNTIKKSKYDSEIDSIANNIIDREQLNKWHEQIFSPPSEYANEKWDGTSYSDRDSSYSSERLVNVIETPVDDTRFAPSGGNDADTERIDADEPCNCPRLLDDNLSDSSDHALFPDGINNYHNGVLETLGSPPATAPSKEIRVTVL